MSGNSNGTPRAENPGGADDGGPVGGTPAATGLENPDASAAAVEAASLEAAQQAIFAEAGISADLLSLRDAVEATLLAASGQFSAMSDAPSTQGIMGVGIGLGDPDSVAFGAGSALANGITLQGDKLILVGSGTTSGNGSNNIALMRLLAN